jgi:polygalacturonase
MPLKFLLIAGLLLLPACAAFAAGAVQNVRDCGAKGDGKTKDTSAAQAALDAAARQGGGEIVFPPGRYLCGTLHLKSHLTLRLLPGTTLAASPDQADFDPYEPLPYDTHADRVTGNATRDVRFLGNDLPHGAKPLEIGPEVSKSAITQP